jgi:hypothetical protein
MGIFDNQLSPQGMFIVQAGRDIASRSRTRCPGKGQGSYLDRGMPHGTAKPCYFVGKPCI